MKKLLIILLLFSFAGEAQINTIPYRSQSGVIRLKQDRGLPNSIKTCSCLATEQAASYVYNASGQPNGSYGANTLDPNFDNAAGAKSSGYLLATDDATFTLEGKVETRDQEVTTDAQRGMIYLRMTASGKAYALKMIPATNYLSIRITNDALTEGSGANPGYLYFNDNVTALIPTYGTGNITFGVHGFDVYVKYDGVEYIRFKSRYHIVKGKAAIKIHSNGLSVFTINHFVRKTLYSNTDSKIFDVRDFGWKQGNTTGSITGGTNTLTVASLNGLAVGDKIIVAIGGEATFNGRAGGTRGTKGVGGQWPLKSYANLTAMQADNTQVNDLRAWNEDTGDIYIYTSGTWIKASAPVMNGAYATETWYYQSKAVPKAFRPTITAINGLVLTLDANASVSTTSANVYFDNNFIITKLLEDAGESWFIGDYPVTDPSYVTDQSSVDDETGITVTIPAGTYAVGEGMFWGRNGVTLKGAGQDQTILFSPDGAASFYLRADGADNAVVEDLQCVGNVGLNGFGSHWKVSYSSGGRSLAEQREDLVFQFPSGFSFAACTNVIARNCKIKDVFSLAFGSSQGSTNVYRYRITMEMTDPLQMYIGWMFQDASADNNTFEECHFTSPYICKAFESFNSLGTQFINCTSVNGLMSFNNGGNFLVDNFQQTFTGNNKPASVHAFEPCINVNINYGASFSYGGEIRNWDVVFEDYVDDRNDLLYGIQVTGGAGNGLLVSGGSYTAPDWLTPADVGPQGIRAEGPNTTVNGFTVVGHQVQDYGINRTGIYVLNGSVLNSMAEYFHVGASVTYTNNTGTKVIVP